MYHRDYFSQDDYEVRCEWGAHGIAVLAPASDAIVIVDVLSFSTCVDVAVANGALVFPYPFRDETAAQYAAEQRALLAQDRGATGYWLSPASLRAIPSGTRLVLPSPNGSTLSRMTGSVPTFAGCPRNAAAVAQAAQSIGPRVAVIPAGERWPDGSLRPAIEDWLGAGAIVAHLAGARSSEAELACCAFQSAVPDLAWHLAHCGSGVELRERDRAEDVELAAMLNTSSAAPILLDGAYTTIAPSRA